MDKQTMINKIKSLQIRTNDYPILLNLVKNTSSKLFVKIIEEILNENLFISDFENIFVNNYSEILNDNIEIQNKIESTYKNMVLLRESIKRDLLKTDKDLYNDAKKEIDMSHNIFIKNPEYAKEEEEDYKYDFLDYVTKNQLSTVQTELIEKFKLNPSAVLLSTTEFKIPLEFDNILLSSSDYDYMIANHITEDEMKKIKALAYYFNSNHNESNIKGDNND